MDPYIFMEYGNRKKKLAHLRTYTHTHTLCGMTLPQQRELKLGHENNRKFFTSSYFSIFFLCFSIYTFLCMYILSRCVLAHTSCDELVLFVSYITVYNHGFLWKENGRVIARDVAWMCIKLFVMAIFVRKRCVFFFSRLRI